MDTQNLEKSIEKLKAIVKEMENPTVKLDKMAELYNEGAALASDVSAQLKAMRGEVKVLNNDFTNAEVEEND